MFIHYLALFGFLFAAQVQAEIGPDEGAFLDPRSELRFPPNRDSTRKALLALPKKTDTLGLIAKMTPVRSQGKRGTCGIFATTAQIEALLVLQLGMSPAKLNLSEEWLEYLVMQNSTSDGSNAYRNYQATLNYGAIDERQWPYVGVRWFEEASALSNERCDGVPTELHHRCLLGHRDPRLLTAPEASLLERGNPLYDPDFSTMRFWGEKFKEKHLSRLVKNGKWIRDIKDIKSLLVSGIPLNLGVDFYFGAWNHRKAEDHGIPRNMAHWAAGIVGYPEKDSLDREASEKEPAGHAFLVVGYDDEKVVETTIKLKNGTVQKFTYQGVYYFKNSWGATSFGTDTQIDGKIVPGYGMITQKYAHELGSFFQF